MAIIANATVINITWRIKKIKDNIVQMNWQIPEKYLHLKFFQSKENWECRTILTLKFTVEYKTESEMLVLIY